MLWNLDEEVNLCEYWNPPMAVYEAFRVMIMPTAMFLEGVFLNDQTGP